MESLEDHDEDDDEIIMLIRKYLEQASQGRRRQGNVLDLMTGDDQAQEGTSITSRRSLMPDHAMHRYINPVIGAHTAARSAQFRTLSANADIFTGPVGERSAFSG